MLPSNNFRLGHGCSLLNTHELIAKGMRFTLEVAQDAITILLFIGVLTRVDIRCARAQEAVNQPGELGGRGRDRLGAAQATAHPPIVAPESAMTARQRLGGDPQGRSDPIGGGLAA